MRTLDQISLRTLVRARMDFQQMRKSMDNRLGRKADGTGQNIMDGRTFQSSDVGMFVGIADEARAQEDRVGAHLKSVLCRFPIYNEWLSNVKGVGEIMAGWILGEFDITVATTVSKMWQYAGLNSGLVRGKKRVKVKEYKPEMGEPLQVILNKKGKPEAYIIVTDEMIRGDKATPGFVLPYNKMLRVVLCGVLGSRFMMSKSPYALDYYYPYKARLEQEVNLVGGVGKPWKDVSKGHRNHAAIRYMIKMFLKDLYVQWRSIEGLPIRAPYQEEYLGMKHEVPVPEPKIYKERSSVKTLRV